MDLSALIFVALAVAWAVYLIPKALKQHEDLASSRPVEGFSDRLRVLARREPVDRRQARLVVTPGESAPVREAEPAEAELPAPLTPAQVRGRRLAAAAAAKRRLRVVTTILALLVVVAVLALVGVLPTVWVAVPGGLLVAWLVACRLMVRKEIAVASSERRRPTASTSATPQLLEPAETPSTERSDDGPVTEEIAVVEAERPEPVAGGWDPVPVTLPTYVGKDPATRNVRTIDLDGTGVFSSGRNAADSALAREAEEAEKTARAESEADAAKRRASGS